MIDLKAGDKVQIDPALVNSGARKALGTGLVTRVYMGGTRCNVQWDTLCPDDFMSYYFTRDFVLVSSAPGGSR